MSAFIFDRLPFETQAAATQAATSKRKCGREAEFRSTLDRYMADYVGSQRRRAAPVPRIKRVLETFAGRLRVSRPMHECQTEKD
jgi:hypothetical protein